MTRHTTLKEYSLTVGLKTQDGDKIEPMEVITRISDRLDGGTFKETKGLWKGDLENSIEFTTIQEGSEHMHTVLEELKEQLETELNQESVLMTVRSLDEVSF